MGKPKILITDDVMSNRLIIRAYFAPYDVEVHEASNGQEALDFLKNNPVDLMILDFVMPVMSGEQVLYEILKEPRLNSIPVIVYTAGGYNEETEEWLRRYSAGFLEKTSLGDDLLPTVKDILGDTLQKRV